MISSLSKFQLLMSSHDYENHATKIPTFHLPIYIPILPRCHLPELIVYQLQKFKTQKTNFWYLVSWRVKNFEHPIYLPTYLTFQGSTQRPVDSLPDLIFLSASKVQNQHPILSCPGQRPRFHNWNFQWIPASNHDGIMFIVSNQNVIIQRMSNQDLKDKQFLCNLFSWTTSQNYHNFQKDEQPLCCLFSWATSSVLIFILSNQSIAFQRMSNHYVYYSLWATTYFFISSSLANEMCQRRPGDAGRILPLVLSYLIRYYLT